jgi:CO/xanthine dehydrogenase Mo-binding subunit/aerobic-type carbon monoxide dehydrogenase small subunit (CoxS/CutS family)
MSQRVHVRARINNEDVEFLCEPRQSLLEVLREELMLTGTKEGCNNGNCGACSVILDGVLVNSCLVLAVEVEGKTVTTIEGIAPPEGLHPLQRAFLEDAAVQCGFCTPGVIMAAKALLDQHPTPTEREVRYWLAGNLCRCTGYDKIVRAVLQAAAVPDSVQKNPAQDKAQQKTYRVIGTRPVRHDGTDKVTGRASFGADIRLPAMLYGKVLRNPHAHAQIRSIDTSEAEALPGVKAVVTAADLSEGAHDLRYRSNNILARDKVLYHGHAVVAVSATSPHIAEEALALIKVDYEVLPPVLDVRKAMRDDAPILLDDPSGRASGRSLRTDELGQKGQVATNIANHIQHRRGDVERGFQEAAVIVEREFHTATVHQGYIEPQTATALYNPDGQLTIWCSAQGAFGVRDQVSDILHIPVSRIRVIPMEIGGGFGGKNTIYLEPVAALLSKKSRHRPVKMVMSRAEVLAATGPTAGSYIRVKMGTDESGRITAAEAYLAYEAGAFPGSFPLVGSGASTIFAPYRLENVQIDGYEVVVNKPKAETYRAPGASNAVFAAEVVIDELCEKLGMDPLEFRAINGAQEGDRRPDGPVQPRIGYLEIIEAARNHPHYAAPLAGPNRGRGVASGFWGNWGGRSSAMASVNPDGTVNLVTGSVDLSGTRTSTAMQLAETLGIPVEDIKPRVADTDSVGYTEGSYGSRTTFATGWAAYELGQRLKRELIERAAQLWEVSAEEVTFEDGVFSSDGQQTCTEPCPERSRRGSERITFKELAARLDETGGPMMVSATVFPEGIGPGVGTHIVDVEVDPETGKVDILRYTAVQDVGKAIHPGFVEGQLHGGVAQGIGWALNEEYVYDEAGLMLNASFLDYRIPTCLDLPMVDTVLVEVPNPGHPYGVRGVGEPPILPPPAAVANAIYRAVGVRMNVLPMSPTNILEALWEKRAEEG